MSVPAILPLRSLRLTLPSASARRADSVAGITSAAWPVERGERIFARATFDFELRGRAAAAGNAQAPFGGCVEALGEQPAIDRHVAVERARALTR